MWYRKLIEQYVDCGSENASAVAYYFEVQKEVQIEANRIKEMNERFGLSNNVIIGVQKSLDTKVSAKEMSRAVTQQND